MWFYSRTLGISSILWQRKYYIMTHRKLPPIVQRLLLLSSKNFPKRKAVMQKWWACTVKLWRSSWWVVHAGKPTLAFFFYIFRARRALGEQDGGVGWQWDPIQGNGICMIQRFLLFTFWTKAEPLMMIRHFNYQYRSNWVAREKIFR